MRAFPYIMDLRLLSLPALGLILAACETGGPIRSSFDPLDAAGGSTQTANLVDTGYRPGEFVTAAMNNTGFFKNRPEGDASADKLLTAGTQMKVITDEGSFVKVELDTGELGYVSSVQIMGESEGSDLPPGSEVQVWPPVDGGDIPIVDDPAAVDPNVPLAPTEVDPDASLDEPILPEVSPEDDPAAEIPPLPEPVAPAGEEDAGEDGGTADDAAASAAE